MVSGLVNASDMDCLTRTAPSDVDEYAVEPIDQLEIFDIRGIKDPEYPYSLEELKVISKGAIEVDDKHSYVRVTFTPTVEHCSMAQVIGLCMRVKLMRSLPPRYKVDIRVAPGTHVAEAQVNKRLNDKECVVAVLENNQNMVDLVDECVTPSYVWERQRTTVSYQPMPSLFTPHLIVC